MNLTAIKETIMRNGNSHFVKLTYISLLSFLLLSTSLYASLAYALRATNEPPQKALDCLGDLQGTISAPSQVDLWQTATLRWNVTLPSSCTGIGVKLYVDNQVVSPIGSRTFQPIADTSPIKLHAALPAVYGGAKRTLAATTAIKVNLPPLVAINANYMAPLLLQALRTPGTYISVANNVELNLSGQEYISIAAGVTLAGGRTAREAGPRLYTTTRPRLLFNIGGDNVRITGVRIQGPDMDVAVEDYNAVGIFVRPTGAVNNIEIDHNELYGWSWAAVQVWDDNEKIDPVTNPQAVRIHDNYIHHNQRVGGNGYGVAVGHGAYALIERNVFDWNRHAISGEDGSDGSGYRAYRNLVLENGGYHDTYNACDIPDWLALAFPIAATAKALCVLGVGPSYTHYTHQFDMHGQDDCPPSWEYNCGTAGYEMEIRYNSFLYTAGHAIKLRGTPQLKPYGAFVISNVFANSLDDAVDQTETGLFLSDDNLEGVNGMDELGLCDFDGDGINDHFLATGQTWWYSSGGDKPWVYLNTSTKRLSQVTLGFFNADNICDVWVDGVVYPGGKTPKPPVNPLLIGGRLGSITLSR